MNAPGTPMAVDAARQGRIATVGIVGLGLMGMACASRLRQSGFALAGHDVDPDKRHAFTDARYGALESLQALPARCELVLLAVFDTDQVESVIEAPGGLLAGSRQAGHFPTIVCTSTCDPDRIAALAARCRKAGLPFIEAPISGTSSSVAQGHAVGLLAGDEDDIRRAGPVLDAICPARHYLGAAGNGARAKLAVNLVLGLNRGAVAEGLVFAERLGLAPEPFLTVLLGSAAYSRVMEVKGTMMARRSFRPPQSRVDQSIKDFRLIADLAGSHGQQLPFAAVYAALLEECVAAGESTADNAAIIEAVARRKSRIGPAQ